MKKHDLKKIALLGLTGGLIISNNLSAAPADQSGANSAQTKTINPADGNMGYHLMTEDELMMELTPEGVDMYNHLTPEGKRLALVVASGRCNGTNECAGLASCKNDKHDCAGKNTCKGTTICAIGDKNLAVKLVHDKMEKKRQQLNESQ